MAEKDEINEYKLEADSELRFEIETKGKTATVELRSGTAELFGTELVRTKPYEFTTGAKVAIFTYQGCVIIIKGYTDVCYQAKETPMIQYLNCHTALEQLRRKAEDENGTGPKVMVCGPTDVGKTTLCRIFLNYAVRMGRRPVYVDVDVGQGNIGVPGTIGALLIERPAAVEENFSQLAPVVYHFGDKSPGKNHTLYDMLITKLAEVTQLRLESNKKAKYSGMIINTCGWVKGGGYLSLLHIAKAFEVDVIFAMDQERLYNELNRDLSGGTKVIYLPKSGGVVERSREIRTESRDLRIREYFYGSKFPLYPHSFDVKWSEMKVYKIGAPSLPDSCMPLGMKAEDNKTKLVQVQPGMNLMHHILAVSFAASVEEDVITSNVAGFICVTNVDVAREVCTVLSPEQRPLPNTLLLMSELMFVDAH